MLSNKTVRAVFPSFLFARGPLLASKITMDSHILAHVKIQYPDDSHSKLKLYISELIIDRKLIQTSSIRNNALHDLT